MKNIKLQVIVPEEYEYKELYIYGRNSVFQNWRSKMKIKKIDDHIHFITFNIMETYLEYKLVLETENGDCAEDNNRFINIIQDCSINNIFYDLNSNDIAFEYKNELQYPVQEKEPVYEPKIITINNYSIDDNTSYYYNEFDEYDSSSDEYDNYTKKSYKKKTSNSDYHLVSGYNKGDTKVKAYARGKVPSSLKKKTIVSGYTKKDGTKVKAYARKKNN
jgi:hypothetical protein